MSRSIRKNLLSVVPMGFVLVLISAQISFAQFSGEWKKWGKSPDDYEIGGNPTIKHGTEGCGYIQSKAQEPKDFVTMANSIKPDPFIGKRVRLSGFIKSENVDRWSGFWMRVDGPKGQQLSFDNMENRPIVGTTDWKKYDVVLDVPPGSVNIVLGVILSGKGKVWTDGVAIEAVGTDIPVTTIDPYADYFAGQFSKAVKIFQNTTKQNPKNLYSQLFYYLSLYRNGQVREAQEYDAKLAGELKEDNWVVPVLRFYAGNLSESELLRAAASNDSTVDSQQKCEAYFYIGMAYQLKMEKTKLSELPTPAKAKEYFEKCVATGHTDFLEYKGAQTELGKEK